MCVGTQWALPLIGDGSPDSLWGRPRIGKEVRDLIRRMSFENPLWSTHKIDGVLLKLAIEVAQSWCSEALGTLNTRRHDARFSQACQRSEVLGTHNSALKWEIPSSVGYRSMTTLVRGREQQMST